MSSDTTPPALVANLHNTTYLQSSITWTWTDPSDSDFDHVLVYLNGVFRANVTKGIQNYTASGLTAGTGYTIGIRTVDMTGNVNPVLQIHLATTAAAGGGGTSLGDAVDAPALTWTTSGNAIWFPETTTFTYDDDAAQSGNIENSQTSSLRTTVAGPATLKFWWKVSSESSFDYLRFYIDGVQQTAISGEIGWRQKSYPLTAGTHTLEWRYTKNFYASRGSDCGWVDKVELM
jgi:hypothetical protein